MNKGLKVLTKALVYSSATVGTVFITAIATLDFNIIIGLIMAVVFICSIFYDFSHSS